MGLLWSKCSTWHLVILNLMQWSSVYQISSYRPSSFLDTPPAFTKNRELLSFCGLCVHDGFQPPCLPPSFSVHRQKVTCGPNTSQPEAVQNCTIRGNITYFVHGNLTQIQIQSTFSTPERVNCSFENIGAMMWLNETVFLWHAIKASLCPNTAVNKAGISKGKIFQKSSPKLNWFSFNSPPKFFLKENRTHPM